MTRRGVHTALISAALLMACADIPDDASAPQLETRGLASEPDLRIGSTEGAAPYLFDGIVSAQPFGEGYIVADRGSATVRIFDSAGEFIREVGGEGDGPGEFQTLAWATGLGSEAVLAFDQRTSRLTQFSASGEVEQTRLVSVDGFDGRAQVVASSGGSPILIRTPGPALSDASDTDPVAEMYSTDAYFLELDERQVEIGARPGSSALRIFDSGAIFFGQSPFLGESYVSSGGGIAAYAMSRESFVERVRSSGSIDTVSVPIPPRTLSDEAWNAYWAGSEPPSDQWSRHYEVMAEETPRPDDSPFIENLLVDSTGEIWVRRFEPTSPSQHWIGLGGVDIEPLELIVRSDVAVRYISRTEVVGVLQDEFDVQQVVVWRVPDA